MTAENSVLSVRIRGNLPHNRSWKEDLLSLFLLGLNSFRAVCCLDANAPFTTGSNKTSWGKIAPNGFSFRGILDPAFLPGLVFFRGESRSCLVDTGTDSNIAGSIQPTRARAGNAVVLGTPAFVPVVEA